MSIPEFKFKGEPLTDEGMKTLTSLLMSTSNEKPLNEEEGLSTDFSAQMLLKRIEAYGLKFQISNFFLVASVLTFCNNPAKLMILLWEAHKYSKKSGKNLLTAEDWCHMFPDGPPTDDECHAFWDSQKAEGEPLGNMLDNAKYWQ
jgi:hypothetical protein